MVDAVPDDDELDVSRPSEHGGGVHVDEGHVTMVSMKVRVTTSDVSEISVPSPTE